MTKAQTIKTHHNKGNKWKATRASVSGHYTTCHGRDAYIHDHCLGYRHDYLLFYQFPNSNLFTHCMLFSREKPLVKSMAPGSIFYHIASRSIFIRICFQIYYSKNPKIPCCTFSLLIFFHVLFRPIYPISYKLIYLFYRGGIDNPSYMSGCKYLFLVCRYLLHSVAWFSYWIDTFVS